MNKGIVIGGAVCLLIIVIWFVGGGSETKAIYKRFDALVDLVEKDGPASTFETVGRTRKIVEFFEPAAAIEYYPGRTLPKDLEAMQGAFVQVWGRLDSASVSIQRHDVELDESGANAVSTLRATSQVMMHGEQEMSGAIEYQIDWVKVDGDWKIERVLANHPE